MNNRHANMRIWSILPLVVFVWIGRVHALHAQAASAPSSQEPPSWDPRKVFAQDQLEPPVSTADMPADVREGYRLFRLKCNQCHSLNLGRGKGDSSAAHWTDIVYRMKDMPSSHMNEAQTKAILRFVIWDDRHNQKKGNNGKQ